MQTVGTYEAKTQFTALLKRAAQGETITIAKHGVPVATLQAVAGTKALSAVEAVKAMKEFGSGRSLKGLSIKSLISQGRR